MKSKENQEHESEGPHESETGAVLLREPITHLPQDRAQLREEWARRSTEARLLTAMSQDPLTARQRQVLQLVGEGKTTREIAVILGVSVKTAETHRARLMQRLDIHEIAGPVRYAIRRGLVQP